MTFTAEAASTRSPTPMQSINSLSSRNFQTIAHIAKSISGLDIGESKRSLVVARLLRRLRALDMADFDAYCDRLNGPDGEEERAHMVSALTTNVTAFFREPHHFDYLAQHLATPPGIASRAAPMRIWCAAASSGEEAYSAALTLLNSYPSAATYGARVLATDINPHVIAAAHRGLYPISERSRIPQNLFQKYCKEDTDESHFSFEESVRSIIRFRELNLLGVWPMRQKFDAIFCRNVAIYFDAPTKIALWRRLVSQLTPGGELYLGHSERIDDPASYGLQAFGITAYRMASR